MNRENRKPNHLIHEKSPYLLQHAYNPVNWYPWSEEAFEKAKAEDKPIFLSIGYSTCHWCHVMAHESFEDEAMAKYLNEHFISIKVDKEERPDIDSIYMAICQAFTGSGGWPTSVFLTSEQKPFFAGTYFPKTPRYGMIGFLSLLEKIHTAWKNNRDQLLESADEVIQSLNRTDAKTASQDIDLVEVAVRMFKQGFDRKYGGFGSAPKFPTPHNLLFLLAHYERTKEKESLAMAEKTLEQMYRGGIFDHIGYGFSRYSTDRYFLVPHFEKMLYDNALLILAYCKCFELTKNKFYLEVAEKTAQYVLREMTSFDGGFYSAQDADSEGEEGKYYVFSPEEIIKLLGDSLGSSFNEYCNITRAGNFEQKSIPNRLKDTGIQMSEEQFQECRTKIYEYRKKRYQLHLDDKILCSWNALMIAAMCHLYRVSQKIEYLDAAKKAESFLETNLTKNDTLCVSYREGKQGANGFLDDYAAYVFALLALYEATIEWE